MKQKITLILIALMFVGCSQRLGDFTIASTRNVDIGANYVRVERSVEGRSMRPIIIVIPLGYPNLEEAIDDALGRVDGELMTNVVINYNWFYIPYIYGQYVYTVKGDVWKKQSTDVGAMFDEAEKIYTAVEENGHLTLVESHNNK